MLEALEWCEDNRLACAEARAHRLYLEAYAKSLKAEIMAKHDDEAVSAQERIALASPEYAVHLRGYRAAVLRDEQLRYAREDKHILIEAWRSANANRRIMP